MATAMEKMLARVGKTRADLAEILTPFAAEKPREVASVVAEEATRLEHVTTKDLSDDQAEVFDAIVSWLDDGVLVDGQRDPQLLSLGGFAGTGKSTVVSLLAEEYKGKVAYCAYTGKAAGVLRKKLRAAGVYPYFCGTIHSLIYKPCENPETGEVSFKKREMGEDGVEYSLIVMDEASMVPDHILEDLKELGIPILAVGDHGQLPPVRGYSALMSRPNLRLEKIHRQAENNPILRLSASIRESGKLLRSLEDGDRIRYVKQADLQAEMERMFSGISEEQLLDRAVITYMNVTRCQWNLAARKVYLGCKDDAPIKNDLVICLKNTDIEEESVRLYNGARGFLRVFNPTESYRHTFEANFEFPDFEVKGSIPLRVSRHQFGQENTFSSYQDLEPFGLTTKRWWDIGVLVDYGYVLTCHKCVAPETLIETAQGVVPAKDLTPTGVVATPSGRAAYGRLVRNAAAPMLEIVTKDGYSLRATPDHGVDVFDYSKDCYVRREARDVRVGDVMRLRMTPEFSELPSPDLPAGASVDVRAKIHMLPTKLSEDCAEFFGLLVGDGTLYRTGFRLAKRHLDVADRFAYLCRVLFGVEPSRFFKLNAHHVEVSSVYVANWLRAIGGMDPNAKDVPACVLKASTTLQRRFLRGLFEDGTVNVKSGKLDHVEWFSTFDVLRRKVRTMLLREGIICGNTTRRPGALYIYGQNAKRFGERVGFVSALKNKALTSPAGEERRYFVPVKGAKRGRVSRHAAQAMLASGNAPKNLEGLLSFHHTPVEAVLPYVGESVCVEVPDGHQFIQDGFCGWNSQGSGFSDVLVVYERGGQDEKTWKRWLYTACTRASERLTIAI